MKLFFKRAPLGLLVGFANGLFGAGGGSIFVPVSQKILKMETHKAHATAIAVILPLSVLSVCIYFWGVSVDWAVALCVSAGGMAGGFTGALLLNKFSSKWLHKIFGLFMVAAAIKMLL